MLLEVTSPDRETGPGFENPEGLVRCALCKAQIIKDDEVGEPWANLDGGMKMHGVKQQNLK